MQKKVLGILGSPCPEGNAAALLDAVLRGAESSGAQTERIDVASLDIRPCDSCRACDTIGACSHFKDDMGIIYSKIREVDVILLASPIYFMGVSAQLKAMIDRCQCFWIERYVLKNRPYIERARPKGFFIATAGSSKKTIFEPAIHCAKAFFAALDYDYAGQILLGDTDNPEISRKREGAIKRAYLEGEKLGR